MSEENVKSVRRVYAAYKRGDLDATARCLHPDVDWHPFLSAKRACRRSATG
jgi:ketosteroid isomerase-like protein